VEQTATMQDPRSIVKQMKPEQLFAEVRARKLKEIEPYHNHPPDEKARQIIKLLRDMKGGKKPPKWEEELVNVQTLL